MDQNHRRERLAAVKEIGKALLKLKSQGLAMTVLKESRVSALGWPDFFVSGPDGRLACLALCLKDGAQDDMPELFTEDNAPGGLHALAARLHEVRESWKRAYPGNPVEFALMILAPRWPEASLCRKWPELQMDAVLLAGAESCQPARLMDMLRRVPTSIASETDLTLLRAFLAPETVLKPAPTPAQRRQQSRARQLSLLPQLLDYDQDLCAKMDLWLPEEAHDTAENFALRLITGSAGTGKSVVLVHRTALLRQFHSEARIAVLTHNRALCSDLESRYHRMNVSDNVEFLTFYSWLGKRWPSSSRVLDDRERAAFLPRSDFDPPFLKDEFDWIHDQGLQSLEEYLAAQRTGRTKPLQEPQRRTLYALLEEYRLRLDREGATDWPRRAFDVLAANPRGPLYDFILVDEAQFFAQTWFKLIRRSLRPGGHLFLCADPAQGFLGRGQSWRGAGLEVKGRSTVLKRPYRNTRQILSFAASRYEQHVRGDEDAPRLQETRQAILRDGPEPAEIIVTSPQEEMVTVLRQARQLIDGGAPPGDLLILCARRQQASEIRHHLSAAGLPSAELDAPARERQERIALGTLDAATGLERPIAILCGLRELANHEQNPAFDEEERRRHRRLNASRLYMGCTRAIERLVLISCGTG